MSNRANRLLAVVILASGVLLTLLWFPRRSTVPFDASAGSAAAEVAESKPPASLAMEGPAPERSPVGPAGTAREVDPPEPTYLVGRLVLDGEAVHGGWVTVTSAKGAFRGRSAIDFEGRFGLHAVPIEPLTLAFELPAHAQRILLPPTLELSPEPGKPIELELDWLSRQVNLRVLDARGNGIPARVEVSGMHLAASLETELDGTAKLSVIDPGLFEFRALARGGLEGHAKFEFDAGEDLGSVLLVVDTPAATNRH